MVRMEPMNHIRSTLRNAIRKTSSAARAVNQSTSQREDLKMIRRTLKVAAVATIALVATSAQAALTLTTPACTVSVLNPAYTACGGSFEGNDKNQQADVVSFIAASGWGAVSFQGSSDTPVTFGPFTSDETGTTGTLTFDAPMDGPFVLALKAANEFSLFYYNGVGPAISAIDFSTLGVAVNRQGIPQGLSHASLYAGAPVPNIPEPETYALMLAGLGFVSFVAKRRRQG
jgi:hypothetical protein